jgi:putative membrane protein
MSVLDLIAQAFGALPVVVLHLVVANLVLALGVWIYTSITPYHELELIRAGNNAAGIALAGGLVGLALPVASALRSALHVYDIVIWGGAALLLQLTAYAIFHLVLRGAPDAIAAGRTGEALQLAATHLAVGLLTAAAIAA